MKEVGLAEFVVLRWDKENLNYIFVEHWGIKRAQVKQRYEKLCDQFGEKNILITVNLKTVARAEVMRLMKELDKQAFGK